MCWDTPGSRICETCYSKFREKETQFKKFCEKCDASFSSFDSELYDEHIKSHTKSEQEDEPTEDEQENEPTEDEQENEPTEDEQEDNPYGKRINKDILYVKYASNHTLSELADYFGVSELSLVRRIKYYEIDKQTGRPIPATTKQIDLLKKLKFWTFEHDPLTMKIASAFIDVCPFESQLHDLSEMKYVSKGKKILKHSAWKIIRSALPASKSQIDELVNLGYNVMGENGPVNPSSDWDAHCEIWKRKPPTISQSRLLNVLKIDTSNISTGFDASQAIDKHYETQYTLAYAEQEAYEEIQKNKEDKNKF